MSNPFFDRPIVNSPYEYPWQHWELDDTGQPTGRLIGQRRRAEFVTPIPKPKKRLGSRQQELVLDEGRGLTTKGQAYDLTSIINEVRQHVNTWRALPATQWQVTPETARLLNHWRHHDFGGVRPFFCQVEAVETAIWFSEVAPHPPYGQTFEQMILENLRTAGVQQAHKEGRITFTSLVPWPGEMICAEGLYREGDAERRAAIFIGPEFGTVSRPDLVAAAREAGDAGFDVLIACAFNYEARASDFARLGRIPILKARMNADLHMGGELKATSAGNLFVVFGEPDIEILHDGDGRVRVHVKGVDVFDPSSGEVRSDGPARIACWFIDTDYNEESSFVRHAYFLGQNDPYGALKTTLKAEIDADAWASLNSEVSRPFEMPSSGRIAVKVINHLGDEVMKVFRVG